MQVITEVIDRFLILGIYNGLMLFLVNSKFQKTSSRQIPNSKDRNSKYEIPFGTWNFMIGACLVPGAWKLELAESNNQQSLIYIKIIIDQ